VTPINFSAQNQRCKRFCDAIARYAANGGFHRLVRAIGLSGSGLGAIAQDRDLERIAAHEPEMTSGRFRRQLAEYIEYHRDRRNALMHVFGIVFLFLAAVLPLSAWNVRMFGAEISLAVIFSLPILAYWLWLDTVLGMAILAAAILLLSVATMIVKNTTATTMWSIFVTLIVLGVTAQVVGHKVFERRQPSLVDHPTHLLLGPMFVMAKLFIAFGFRDDLAAIIEPGLPASTPSSNRS
jgi:uncharacterized membrane protein YGL010W